MAATRTAAGPSLSLLSAATDAIYRAWLPLIGEVEAREQAQAFASRFQIEATCPITSLQVTA